ncbi:MAG: ribosomal-processing cysteine protease Prp [Christensenellales bacterium]|jgi:uncharacterized protein YsxB (DUF464 family)
MITVIPLMGKKRRGFHASGHSGSAPRGSDIICAAVSALTQTAYFSLRHYGIGCLYNRDDEKGMFALIADDCEITQIIFTNMYCGLKAIADTHPQHLRVAPFQEVEA